MLSEQCLPIRGRRKNPSRSTGTRQKSSRSQFAQRMRRPLRFRAVGSLSRPTPTRIALKPEFREQNRRRSQFGPSQKKRQRGKLRQVNPLRRQRNGIPVVALRRLPRNGRRGRSRKPANPECAAQENIHQCSSRSDLRVEREQATLGTVHRQSTKADSG